VKVSFVCLEHGKDNPRAAIPYKIVPISEFNSDPNVAALCALLGKGKIDQRSAQAAAWHLANGMSWAELAAKRIERLDGSSSSYFSQLEIQGGMQAANAAVEIAKDFPRPASPGAKTTSASSAAGQ
jgi:hypothetical protein